MIKRLDSTYFDQLYDIFLEHTTNKLLPNKSNYYRFYKEAECGATYHIHWKGFYYRSLLNTEEWFCYGDVDENDKVISFVFFKKFKVIGSDEIVCGMNYGASTKKYNHTRIPTRKRWTDSIFAVYNYAIEEMEKEGITTFYEYLHLIDTDWDPITKYLMDDYVREYVEAIRPGDRPSKIDYLLNLTDGIQHSVAIKIVKYTKEKKKENGN